MNHLVRILPALLACLLLPLTAAAERVESFDSVLTVQPDGALLVAETIVYDFEGA